MLLLLSLIVATAQAKHLLAAASNTVSGDVLPSDAVVVTAMAIGTTTLSYLATASSIGVPATIALASGITTDSAAPTIAVTITDSAAIASSVLPTIISTDSSSVDASGNIPVNAALAMTPGTSFVALVISLASLAWLSGGLQLVDLMLLP